MTHLQVRMASQQTTAKSAVEAVLKPAKNSPAHAEQFVRGLVKQKPRNLNIAAAELAPLFFGLARNDEVVLPRMRAQALFKSPELMQPFAEFIAGYMPNTNVSASASANNGVGASAGVYGWGLPVAKWTTTMALVRKRRSDLVLVGITHPSFPTPTTSIGIGNVNANADADEYYARFILDMLFRLKNTKRWSDSFLGGEQEQEQEQGKGKGKGLHLLKWLRDTRDEDDVCWVLFHALLFLQLETMRSNKAEATLKDRAMYLVGKMSKMTPSSGSGSGSGSGPGSSPSLLDEISCFVPR